MLLPVRNPPQAENPTKHLYFFFSYRYDSDNEMVTFEKWVPGEPTNSISDFTEQNGEDAVFSTQYRDEFGWVDVIIHDVEKHFIVCE